MGYRICALTAPLLILIIALTSDIAFSGDRYIQITHDRVNIRIAPNLDSEIVARSRKGDIFRLISEEGEWFRVAMFSGEGRYLYKSLARMSTYVESLPEKGSALEIIVQAIKEAEARALKKVSDLDIVDINKILEHNKLLNDRYILEVFHMYDVQPANYPKIEYERARENRSRTD